MAPEMRITHDEPIETSVAASSARSGAGGSGGRRAVAFQSSIGVKCVCASKGSSLHFRSRD